MRIFVIGKFTMLLFLNLIIDLDQKIFLFLNHLPHNFLLDSLFSLISFSGRFGIIWFLIAIFSILTKEKKNWHFLIPLGFAMVSSYFLVEFLFKPFFGRFRPEFVLPSVIVVYSPFARISYSFPSGHATIAFACALVLLKTLHQERLWPLFLAFLVAFSRIYLGKHFPLDVVFGGLLGFFLGWVSLFLTQRFLKRFWRQ